MNKYQQNRQGKGNRRLIRDRSSARSSARQMSYNMSCNMRGELVLFFWVRVLGWCNKKEPTVALSSTEAESRAATMATQECFWLLQQIREVGEDADYSVDIQCNNQSAIRLAANPVFYARTKHIEVHHHSLRERVLNGKIDLVPVRSKSHISSLKDCQPHRSQRTKSLMTC